MATASSFSLLTSVLGWSVMTSSTGLSFGGVEKGGGRVVAGGSKVAAGGSKVAAGGGKVAVLVELKLPQMWTKVDSNYVLVEMMSLSMRI